MKILRLPEVTSTNAWLRSHDDAEHGMVVVTDCQTAGRGQRGNSWEAEPGKNLTFSLMLRPAELRADRQFVVSSIVSLAIVRLLDRMLDEENAKTLGSLRAAIKWPNDIYVDDRKIAGILIENTLTGPCIDSSIVGIGLNVNQQQFFSNAPNPVSLVQLTGRNYDLSALLEEICRDIIDLYDNCFSEKNATDYEPSCEAVMAEYRRRLWRADGFHPYRDNIRDENILARIFEIAPTGILTLELTSGERRSYAFKEVSHLL